MAFWSKDEKLRIDETIAYVCDLCPAVERITIKSFLEKKFNNPAIQQALSASLSTKGHDDVGNKAVRAGRRALTLLSGDMFQPGNPLKLTNAQAMALPAGTVTARLNALIKPLRLFATQQEGVRTLLQMEFNELKSQPMIFLNNNMVICQSYGVAPGGVQDHKFYYDYNSQSFVLWPVALGVQNAWIGGNGLPVRAINVPETYWKNVPGRGAVASGHGAGTFAGIVATDLTGADLMVTSAFTGCTFCFKSGGGGTYAAHISPATAQGAESIGAAPELPTQLIANGNFAAPAGATAGALQVWGRNLANVVGHPAGYTVNALPGISAMFASMYVFGIHTGGGWHFYSQENDMGARTVTQLL